MAYQDQKQTVRQAFEQAKALHLAERVQEAVAAHRHVLELDPDCAPSLHALGRIHLQGGHAGEAVPLLKRASDLAPDQPTILNDYAVALISNGQPELAVDAFRLVMRMMPDNAEVQRNLGLLLVTHGRFEEALPVLKSCVRLAPSDGDAHLLLGNVYCNLEMYADALDQLALAIAAKPKSPAPYETLGIVRHRQGRPQEALEAFDEALKRNPDMPVVIGHKGVSLAALGRFDEARAALRTAISSAREIGTFLRTLADLGPFTPEDDRLPMIEAQKPRLPALSRDDQVEVHLALGKAYDDLERRGEAMHHWQAANSLHGPTIPYNEAAELKQLEDIAKVFTREMLADPELTESPSQLPVFIVGMPRSGTSLVEQILASHPDVYGAGELNDWEMMISGDLAGQNFPAHVTEVPADRWHQLGSRYIDHLKAVGNGAKRVTDKMPPNFRWLGAIHLALPRAKFIHIHRDPADCALSCFSKCFPHGFGYIYDQGNLGRYMRAYETLMAHWKRVLPEGCLLDVCYEDLVRDFDGEVRRMLDFIGLDWNDACKAFYKTDRQVMTASVYAVRQPLSARAIGRAKAYGPWLKPFLDAYAGA